MNWYLFVGQNSFHGQVLLAYGDTFLTAWMIVCRARPGLVGRLNFFEWEELNSRMATDYENIYDLSYDVECS